MNISQRATRKVSDMLSASDGLTASVAGVAQLEQFALPAIGDRQILSQNVTFEVAERSNETKYPAVYIYCEKLANLLREKFRTFSGKAHMALEVRVSQDRFDGLDKLLHLYVDAVTNVLDKNRGDWGNGMFYTGGYEAVFGPMKHGGKNLIQAAKITFEIEVSSN